MKPQPQRREREKIARAYRLLQNVERRRNELEREVRVLREENHRLQQQLQRPGGFRFVREDDAHA